MTTCAECEVEIDVDEFDVDRNDQLSCPECATNLVVVSRSPGELDVMFAEDDVGKLPPEHSDGDDDDEEWDE